MVGGAFYKFPCEPPGKPKRRDFFRVKLRQSQHLQWITRKMFKRLPAALRVDIPGLLVVWDIANHGVAVEMGKDCGNSAQNQTAQLTVLEVKDKRGGRSPFRSANS